MNRQTEYDLLVQKRKQFQFSEGLYNPSQIEGGIYDQGNHLGPWSAWQGNLEAKILIIGQDWGDVRYYRQFKGCDMDKNPTNQNLAKLLKGLHIDVGMPSKPNPTAPTFFTNAILGLKITEGMSGKVLTTWARESTKNFLIPLLHIINPKIVITLGAVAYEAVASIYSLPVKPLRELVANNPIQLNETMRLYAMFHCGGLGVANRSLALQEQDWQKIQVD